jgi:hypothetical protein
MPVILGGNTSISLSSFPQGIETDNLVLYLDAGNPTSYPGTGNTWFDISGSSNNSTLVNSPTFSSANQGSFLFNGTSQYVNVPNSALFQNNTNMSISIWFNTSTIPSGSNYTYSLMGQGRQEDKNYFWLYLSGSTTPWERINWEVGYDTSNYIQQISNWAPLPNTWYNITATFEPGICKIYLNGSQVITTSTPVGSPTYVGANNPAFPFSIGSYRGPLAHFWPGNLNFALFYKKTLNLTEVTKNFNATRNRYGV